MFFFSDEKEESEEMRWLVLDAQQGAIGLVRAEHSRLYAFQMYIKEAKSEPEK